VFTLIVVMQPGASEREITAVCDRLRALGFQTHLSTGVEHTIIGAIGDRSNLAGVNLETYPGVEKLVPIMKPFKLASREYHPDNTVIDVAGVQVGGERVVVIAGPCAVESRKQLLTAARGVRAAGADLLRAGAFKPRTSPYSFQGLEEEGLEILLAARAETGLPIVTEVMDQRGVEMVAECADMVQVGARNMQNFNLLRDLGQLDKPVLLKRGPSATVEEWLMAAEYILSSGNSRVVLCERGIRTFETGTRNTLDVSAVPAVKLQSHLPVLVDPSHGTGRWRMVAPMALAAIAAGADGVMVEVHPCPEEALSDGAQSLHLERFAGFLAELRPVAEAVGRRM
jgi:3-deoxy-7-phosphoheptulonate synthase